MLVFPRFSLHALLSLSRCCCLSWFPFFLVDVHKTCACRMLARQKTTLAADSRKEGRECLSGSRRERREAGLRQEGGPPEEGGRSPSPPPPCMHTANFVRHRCTFPMFSLPTSLPLARVLEENQIMKCRNNLRPREGGQKEPLPATPYRSLWRPPLSLLWLTNARLHTHTNTEGKEARSHAPPAGCGASIRLPSAPRLSQNRNVPCASPCGGKRGVFVEVSGEGDKGGGLLLCAPRGKREKNQQQRILPRVAHQPSGRHGALDGRRRGVKACRRGRGCRRAVAAGLTRGGAAAGRGSSLLRCGLRLSPRLPLWLGGLVPLLLPRLVSLVLPRTASSSSSSTAGGPCPVVVLRLRARSGSSAPGPGPEGRPPALAARLAPPLSLGVTRATSVTLLGLAVESALAALRVAAGAPWPAPEVAPVKLARCWGSPRAPSSLCPAARVVPVLFLSGLLLSLHVRASVSARVAGNAPWPAEVASVERPPWRGAPTGLLAPAVLLSLQLRPFAVLLVA
uniref:Uncharacterized protein n=1 Tax=Ixodes scapularis TaxID=6945 RepID=A0A4D5RB11_IXOSC